MLLVTRRMAFLTDKSRVFFAFSISIAFLWQLKGLHEKTCLAKCRTVNVWCKSSFSFPGRQSIWEITGTVGKIDKIATKLRGLCGTFGFQLGDLGRVVLTDLDHPRNRFELGIKP